MPIEPPRSPLVDLYYGNDGLTNKALYREKN